MSEADLERGNSPPLRVFRGNVPVFRGLAGLRAVIVGHRALRVHAADEVPKAEEKVGEADARTLDRG